MYKPEVVFKLVDQFVDEIVNFLRESGVEVKSQKLSNIKRQLQEIVVLSSEKDYVSVVTDKNGYIKGYNIMDTVIENVDLPKDLDKGYYKINKNNKPVLDKKRRRDLWGD